MTSAHVPSPIERDCSASGPSRRRARPRDRLIAVVEQLQLSEEDGTAASTCVASSPLTLRAGTNDDTPNNVGVEEVPYLHITIGCVFARLLEY